MFGHRTWQILRIAARNFWRFRLQAILIIFASMTGTGGVIVSTGYAVGGRQKVLNQFARLGTNVIIVTPQQSRAVGGRARTGTIVDTLTDADYKAIRQSVGSIVASSATVATVLRMRAGDLTKKTTIVGCEPDYFAIKHWQAVRGNTFDGDANRQMSRVVLLGATTARDLFGKDDPTGERISINRVPFTVIGVLAERGQSLDVANEDDQVYVPLATGMRRLMDVDSFNSILFEIDTWQDMDATTLQMNALLADRHKRFAPDGKDFQVQSQKSLIETQLASFARLTFLVRWIGASALGVSSLGIFAITWIEVRDRTQEIGTRRALGGTRKDILIQFFTEGTAGALIGCGTGLVTSNFALRAIDRLINQPFMFSMEAALVELLLSIFLYEVFLLFSSLRAIRVEPVAAMRVE